MSHCRQAGWDMTLRACGHTRYSFNQLKSFIHAFHEAGVDTDAQVLILLLARAKAEVKRVYQIYRSGQYVKMFPWNTIAFARED